MTDRTDKAKTEQEREKRGIPPEMEEGEAKGGPHDDRLQSEVSHGKPGEEKAP